MREVVCIFVQWDCLDRVVRDFLSTENRKQRRAALVLFGGARVLLVLWCTHRHWMSCGALPGMPKCPGDLLSPRGSNTDVPRAVPDGIAEGQHPGGPVASCSRINFNRVVGQGGRAVGCVLPSPLCPPGDAPGKWPQALLLPPVLCHTNPSPRLGQNRADGEE